AVLCATIGFSQEPVPRAKLYKIPMPDAIQHATNLGHADPNKVMAITVSLPYADPAGIEAYADDVSNPESPNYRNFITPSEVGSQFGISDDKLQAVVSYLKSRGLR